MPTPSDPLLKDGDVCIVVAGTHKGKRGTVRDLNISKSGHLTITVVQANGERFKTLGRNVEVQAAAVKGTARAPKVKLLSGGNPQIAKGDGDAPVRAYIAAVPGWRKAVCEQLDALIMKLVPQARKAVKWNSPFYGVPEQGWFVSYHVFTGYVKLTFFKGTSLKPMPPGGTSAEGRWINIGEAGFNEQQVAAWIKQAAALPGWLA